MKKRAALTFILSFAAFAASIYSLAAAAAYQPYAVQSAPNAAVSPSEPPADEPSNAPQDNAAPPFTTKVIRLYRDRIAVFEENSDTPIKLLSTDVSQLPDDAMARLNDGIYAYTAEQYQNYIEDFS